MKAIFGRTGLILALLSLSLATAVSIGLDAGHNVVTAQAHVAGFQLQGGPEADEGSVAPEAEADNTATCTRGASHCPSPKQELALVLSEDRRQQESKAFVVPGEEVQPKSKD